MSVIAGYQSDINLQNIGFVGDFPLQHNVGDFGLATGTNNYQLILDPPLTTLRIGMVIKVAFQNSNNGAATLKINSTAAKPLKKFKARNKIDVASGDLGNKIFIIIWDGVDYVIVNIKEATNRRLFASFGTWLGDIGIEETDFGDTYTMPAGTLMSSDMLEINIAGFIQNTIGYKTLRVYIGNEEVFTYTTNKVGNWSIKVLGGRFNTDVFKGDASINHNGVAPAVQLVETGMLNMDTTDQIIRITYQNEVSNLRQLNRFSFMVRHIV